MHASFSRAIAGSLVVAGVVCAAGLALGPLVAQGRGSQEWLTWGGDIERTGWNRAETTLSKASVGKLTLKWKAQIDKEVPLDIESGASMLTAPLVVQGVRTPGGTKTLVYTLAASNTIAALDVTSGTVVWQQKIENTVAPVNTATWVCTNTSTATPVIDKAAGLIYLIAADGRLHAMDIATGQRKLLPPEFVPPYSRNWSLNLVDGVLYTTVGRGCGNAPVGEDATRTGYIPPSVTPAPPPAATAAATAPAAPAAAAADAPPAGAQATPARRARPPAVASHMIAIDLKNPAHPVTRFFTSPSRPGGAWTRAGLAWGHDSFFVQTADGAWDPPTGQWGQTLLRLAPKTLQVMDYFTPPNLEEINSKDLDYASGGTVALTVSDRKLVVSAGKDGTVYLHDALSLGGADHRTPLHAIKAGNDEMSYASTGVWGAPATSLDAKGRRWVYLPMWGPPSASVKFDQANGDAVHGSIMAFEVSASGATPTLGARWVSRDLAVPDSPVVANGVVYAISTGENTLQRHTDPRYHAIYQKPGEPPLPKTGTLTAAERGQNTTHATLYAFDAETGRELYSSKDIIDDWTHLSSITVVDGMVYVTTRQSFVYAFGVGR